MTVWWQRLEFFGLRVVEWCENLLFFSPFLHATVNLGPFTSTQEGIMSLFHVSRESAGLHLTSTQTEPAPINTECRV